jgi:hypothetical protein
MVIESSKTIQVKTTGPYAGDERATHDVNDKRPKKENEVDFLSEALKGDVDFNVYGYIKPEKIRQGHLTLRTFDEILSHYKENKSIDTLNNLAKKHNLNTNDLHILLEYFKPLSVVQKDRKKNDDGVDLIEVFPNLKQISSS